MPKQVVRKQRKQIATATSKRPKREENAVRSITNGERSQGVGRRARMRRRVMMTGAAKRPVNLVVTAAAERRQRSATRGTVMRRQMRYRTYVMAVRQQVTATS